MRQHLAENGFAITREALVRDRGTLYTVMEAKAGKMELSLSQVWGGVGLAHDRWPIDTSLKKSSVRRWHWRERNAPPGCKRGRRNCGRF